MTLVLPAMSIFGRWINKCHTTSEKGRKRLEMKRLDGGVKNWSDLHPTPVCVMHRRSRITLLKRDHSFSGSLRVNNNKNNNNNNMSDAINDAELQEVSVCKFVNKYSFKRVGIVHGFFRGIIFFFELFRPKLDPFQAKGRGLFMTPFLDKVLWFQTSHVIYLKLLMLIF